MAKQKFLNLQTEVIWRQTFIVLVQTDINSKNNDTYLTVFKECEQYEAEKLGNISQKEYEEIVENLKNEGKNLVKY